jgi:predicted SprT family Zn-dependent metalloprotease
MQLGGTGSRVVGVRHDLHSQRRRPLLPGSHLRARLLPGVTGVLPESKSMSGAAANQTNLFAGAVALPNAAELKRRFQAINAQWFAGALPETMVQWSTRMRIAGTCDQRRRVIRLSRHYHEQFPEDVDDTLRHEMIHLLHPGHGVDFRSEARRIGAGLHCREYPGLHPKARLIYICPHCHAVFRRARRERLYCGHCGGGRVDERFALVLRETQTPRRSAKGASSGRPASRPRSRAVAATLDLFAALRRRSR